MRIAKVGLSETRGPNHELVLKCRHNEALIKQDQGKNQEAVELYKELLEDRERVLGATHIDTLKTALNLGMGLYRTSKYEEAIPLMQQTLKSLEKVSGRRHPFTLTCMMNLSLALSKQQPGSEEAIRLAREAAEQQLLVHGSDMEETWITWRDLALVLKDAGEFSEAEQFMRRALHGYQTMYGFQHGKTKEVQQHLCDILAADGKTDESDKLRKECDAKIVTKADEAPTPQERGPIVAFGMSMYIVPDHRGKGYGQAELGRWKTRAKQADAASLQVLAKSEASIKFFRKKCDMIKVCERNLQNSGVTYAHLHYNF
jgi:tetratricopeptide (TPR) repeat protein